MSGTTRSKAEKALMVWATNDLKRDFLVLNAVEAGVPINRIADLTGLARTTIYRILTSH